VNVLPLCIRYISSTLLDSIEQEALPPGHDRGRSPVDNVRPWSWCTVALPILQGSSDHKAWRRHKFRSRSLGRVFRASH
jgi:hypothetical protein